jgi:hypothetical protein
MAAVKYMLLIYSNPANWEPLGELSQGEALSPEQQRQFANEHAALRAQLADSGEKVGGQALAVPAETTTVRVRDGELQATDGPYVEMKEHLAGYYLVECDSRERAIEIAASLPDARLAGVEVRPIVDVRL